MSGLPPELVSLLDVDRKRRSWRRYTGLWAGAVMLGLVVGIGPSFLGSAVQVPTLSEPTVQTPSYPENAPIRVETSEAVSQAAVTTGVSQPVGATTSTTPANKTFGFCHSGGGSNCVVDGDTLWIEGQKVRVADIDAPETHDFKCPEEKALGDRSTQRLIELVNAGTVSLEPIDRDQDVYGRKLRIVRVNGTSVGDTLVSEGLARYYEGGRRPWC